MPCRAKLCLRSYFDRLFMLGMKPRPDWPDCTKVMLGSCALADVCRGCPSLRRLGALWPGEQSTELDGSFHQGDSGKASTSPQAMPSDLRCRRATGREPVGVASTCLACSPSLRSLQHRMVDQIEKAEVAETQRPPSCKSREENDGLSGAGRFSVPEPQLSPCMATRSG